MLYVMISMTISIQRKFINVLPSRTKERGKFWVYYRQFIASIYGSEDPVLTENDGEDFMREDGESVLNKIDLSSSQATATGGSNCSSQSD